MSEVKRLHISGLNPVQCSVQDLHARFQSFQLAVRQVFNWPPGQDGVGNVQNWCFVTVEGEALKIRRAIDVLNGTVWKGSKMRVGTAKKENWKDPHTISKSNQEQDVSKKRKRRATGIESERVSKPVDVTDVEQGVWGWKKTPAGHLLRPLHLRPDHPLPKPIAGPAEPNAARRKRSDPNRLLTRAKRVTVDPTRYGAIHLSGAMLDDGTESIVGCEWTCEESEAGDTYWRLRDKEGNVLREEVKPVPRNEQSLSPVQSSDEDESDESTEDDEVLAAIDNAVDDSDADQASDHQQKDAPEQEWKANEQTIASHPAYDPGEESDFSEGYQEVQQSCSMPVKNWEEEKTGALNLLKSMFGGEIPSAMYHRSSAVAMQDDTSEEGELVQAQAQPDESREPQLTEAQKRRAALLTDANRDDNNQRFQPMVRFDPGTSKQEQDNNEDMQEEESEPAAVSAEKQHSIKVADHAGRVEMSSLKDMFRPKEDSAGFSLLDDLDLDLEEEDEEEDEEMQQVMPRPRPVPAAQWDESFRAKATIKLPAFFPSNDSSWLNILRADPGLQPFRKTQTDDEITTLWKARKGRLTQDYKRRHREALKKKKRKYTGSRAAGTSLPLRV